MRIRHRKRLGLALTLVLTAGLFPVAAEQETTVGPLEAGVRSLLSRSHPESDRITILEVRLINEHQHDSGDLKYVVLAHAIPGNLRPADLAREIFVVLEASGGALEVSRNLAVIPSLRWNDYRVWIESATLETVVLVGEGSTYRDQPGRWIVKVRGE